MDTTQNWFEDNRANWDDRAALHEASGYGIPALIADPSHLSAEVAQDRERLGDLSGLDVVHLQCHLGTDTVSLSRLGPRRVVGVDLSGESLRRARDIAERAGAPIEYVEANVYDARTAVEGDFDLVYTSLGVLCWLPDVAAWARVVASLLRPGGRFLIRDDHPMFMTVGDDVSDGLRIEQPYFQRAEPMTWDQVGSYVETPADAPEFTHGVSHEWNHSIGEILTALLRAGLVLDSFEETPYSAWTPWPDLMVADGDRFRLREDPDRLAMQFVLTAHRPA
ncbi:bifunctional 2-polyprenyl-6-hydroxyphenol methylase/3-demethylubiquinol 3-O-methyltransferase UbiG [Brachybacterium sp. YJGR34]|uniref:class I SAM-dependent methyltransferase n=1 Tax=Brachybacterium sp. YJGR34 TaxID=2059911 RepID=UPI000E0AD4D0|nr:class I SAM-dependent methyltransferase [Brachybacterium sp. YJGR34]